MTNQNQNWQGRKEVGRWFRRISFVILTSAAVACAADVLTLEQAVSLSMENNRGLKSSAIEILKAQDRLAATRTRQYPSINLYMLGAQQLRSFDFTLEKGVLGNYQGTGPLPSEDVHLKTPMAPTGLVIGKIAQPISTLVRIRRNMETQKTGVTLAEEQTRGEQQKIARDVKRIYYSLQQVESSLRSVRLTELLYAEVEKLTANYVIQEVALRGDLLDTQRRLAQTQQTEMQLQNQQASSKEQLNQLMGRDVLTEFEVEPAVDIVQASMVLDDARIRALKDRSEIRQAALKQKQAEQDLRAKKAEYIPEISAEFNNLSFLNWGRFMPTQTTSVGVSLSWEPFDWGRRKHEAAEKRRTVEQAKVTKLDAESQVLVDVNDKYRQLRYRRAELRVARLSQESSLESLRVVKNKYGVNAVLLKDILQSQVNLEQSNADYQQALSGFWNARADFERALGEDQ